MQNQKNKLELNVVTPSEAVLTVECDDLRLSVADGTDGKGGGLMGIRYGHADAVIALSKGRLTAYLDGNKVLSAETAGGFAKVEKSKITVITEALIKQE